MSTRELQLERRAGQRFDFHLRVSISMKGREDEGTGFTQNLSAKGMFLQTDFPLSAGDAVEIVVVMPSEITLTESMPVRCRGKVLRYAPATVGVHAMVAVQIENYDYLPQVDLVPATREPLPREILEEA